jgi:acetyl-CoA carboxylase carboxyltransferase component
MPRKDLSPTAQFCSPWALRLGAMSSTATPTLDATLAEVAVERWHFRTPIRARHKGAVRAGMGDLDTRLDGREVVTFIIDSTERRGALSEGDGELIAAAATMAREMRRPLIGVLSSSGADILGGIAALHGWGTAAKAVSDCSGLVPVIFVVDGPAVSGVALLLGLADIVIMTESSYAFVSGPSMVADFTGIHVDNDSLGGTATHAKHTGLPSFVAGSLDEALDRVAEVLAYLPDHVDTEAAFRSTDDATDRDAPELDTIIPATSTGSYDVRNVAREIADDGEICELRNRWAPNLVTAFSFIGGRACGIVANQPVALAGTLDIPAAQKGAWFVALCDAFNLSIITLVDTPGYFPGKDLEWRGMIRHGAQMAFAYAEATVPRICVVMRKAYGGAYIVMDCKTMGNDLCLAWPTAELAVMGAKGAVQILYRRETEETRLEHETSYAAAYLNPYVAAERGLVDMVIAPHETRRMVTRGLDLLSSKREMLSAKRHGNSPL